MAAHQDEVPNSAETEIDLRSGALYFNRELSMIKFYRRILELAEDESIPLLERLRFLCISTATLDEFFEIRVAGLKEKAEIAPNYSESDQIPVHEVLRRVKEDVQQLVDNQYQLLHQDIYPALEAEGIHYLPSVKWRSSQRAWLHQYFLENLLPVLSPQGLDPAHPFPSIINKGLAFIVSLKGKDAFGRTSRWAVIQAPRSLPRVIILPTEEAQQNQQFVLLSSIIQEFGDELFHGVSVEGMYQFRVTRNSDLFVDEEEIDDLLRAVQGELAARRHGEAVRLEIDQSCPDSIVEFLLATLKLSSQDLYKVAGPVNLHRLISLCDLEDKNHLRYPTFTPALPKNLEGNPEIFSVLRKKDELTHHPFDSFLPFIDFLRQAANDPSVLAIKQTLYRTSAKSAVVDALVNAAQNGKEVTVVIELKARFDEAANIKLANRLQKAGAQVVYGVVGYKTHVKMALVVRREEKALMRYVHLSTGNYHPNTARLYTDYGLFTSDKKIGEDVHNIFMQLTSLGKVQKLHYLLQAPFNLHSELIDRIEREAENSLAGKPARIIAKMNSIIDPEIIRALYKASQAGVQIDLIIRGICALRPAVPGVSDNIRVRSILGRFLEHTRVYYFKNGENDELFCASADWMPRNFVRRVELAFPIHSKKLKDQILGDLELYLQDTKNCWHLNSDGIYVREIDPEQPAISAQEQLMSWAENRI